MAQGTLPSVYDRFVRALEEEFATPDGGVHPTISSFTGISPYAEHGLMEFDNLVSMCQVVEPDPSRVRQALVCLRAGGIFEAR